MCITLVQSDEIQGSHAAGQMILYLYLWRVPVSIHRRPSINAAVRAICSRNDRADMVELQVSNSPIPGNRLKLKFARTGPFEELFEFPKVRLGRSLLRQILVSRTQIESPYL